ncbi:RpiR family transcriptional regulator [Serratia fonticola]|uniref:MurR/RpiR family transcriptional regulator n=1 Tax=Serratia fonticola TaxID=47917 RepID=UPI0008FD703C|nr:MurR/RpiR family transcriptional regulator [Serratia fonticola]MBC3252801.1 MurR/RpiR family transcriptional regulator [Serratia fonticola]OIX90447.1 RpiR family transcriptional regulator [Serratia fonticola]QCR59984.1 MurR/RpiR family transcriptional regulator [Serratia fonticola]
MKQIDERLRSEYPQLAPQEQRVADFIFDHFDDLISYNSAELARLSGVSKATVSRLFKRLGYASYRAMRDELRTLRQSGMPLTENRDAVHGNTLLARHYQQEMANLTYWVQQIDAAQFGAVIAAMGQSRRLLLLGMRNSYPVAMHLRQQLMQVREQVLLIPQPGQTLAEDLVDLGPQDMVVVVAFRRRPRLAREVLQQLQIKQVPTLLICEPQAQALIPLASWHLMTPLDSVSAFDSYSSAMSLASLLSNALLHDRLSQGRQRIHQVANLFSDLEELELR